MTGNHEKVGVCKALEGVDITYENMRWIRTKKLKAKKVRGYAIDGADVREFLLAQVSTKRKPVIG